jgi:iron complex outermembrane receptor protein
MTRCGKAASLSAILWLSCVGCAVAGTELDATKPESTGASDATPPVRAGDASKPTSDTNSLEEIIVTAEKRSQSINKVGLTISAFSGSALETQGVKSVADLAQLVPGLTYTNSFTDQPVYTLRGVGFYETSLQTYPAVSVYVDQVPLPFPALTTIIGGDLERVEVLKGPQGILFGQNSTGGAINYIVQKPTDDFRGGFDVGAGSYRDLTADGFISGPLSSTVKARLSFDVDNAEGWQHPYFRPQPGTNGAVAKYDARLLVDWTPSDKLKFELNMNGWVDQSQPIAPQKIETKLGREGSVVNGPFLLAYPNAPADPHAADWSVNNPPSANNRFGQISLRGDYNVRSSITLTSISSYDDYSRNSRAEYAGVYTEDLELLDLAGTIKSVTQELRLANSGENSTRWLIGTNYEHSKVYDYNVLGYSGGPTGELSHVSHNPFFSDQIMKNYAGFANIDYDIVREVTVKAGARYTESDRSTTSCSLGGGGGGVDALFDSLNAAFHPGVNVPPLQENDCFSYDPLTLFPVREGYKASLNEHNVSWRGGIDFNPTSNVLIYALVAKGYKAGSFPTISASTTFQYLPVKQESVQDSEAGFKVGLLDRTLQINGAIFNNNYADKQIRSQVIQPIFGPLNNLVNIPKSRINGADVDVTWQPIAGLRLTAGGTFLLDAKILNFTGFNGDVVFANYAGARLPYSPKLSMTGTADYSWNLSVDYVASLGITWSHRSTSNATFGGRAIYDINPYDLLDVHAGIGTADGKYHLRVWGKNITDKYYWNNAILGSDTIVRYAEMPATFGVTFSVRF